MAKKKWKAQNQTNSQTTRRAWIEGLLQMTIFAHSNDIYIGNTKLFSVGLDFLTFGAFIASMLLLPSFRKNTYILAKGRNPLQVHKRSPLLNFQVKANKGLQSYWYLFNYMSEHIKWTNSITQSQFSSLPQIQSPSTQEFVSAFMSYS